MKRITVLIIVMTIMGIFLIGCGNDKTQNQETVRVHDYYKITDDAEDDLAALFYLCYGQEQIEKAVKDLLNKYNMPVEKALEIDYEVVNADNGDEWYLILPKYEESTITVHSVKLNDQGSLEVEKELITTEKPVLLQCNLSDIIPSSQVTVTFKDKTIVFNPFISLKDGKISEIEGVYTK